MYKINKKGGARGEGVQKSFTRTDPKLQLKKSIVEFLFLKYETGF